MKLPSKLLFVGLAAFALSLSSHAAPITWGTAQVLTNNTDIQSAGLTGLAGADFGRTNGTTTIVNNGSVDVEFKSMNSNQNVTLSNGVTVSASGYNFDVACSAPAGVTGNYRTVMTRHMGVGGGAGNINLTGLTIGTEYQIQAYITGSDPNTSTISGSPPLVAGGGNNPGNNNGFGKWITGTFTADATSQPLTHTATSTEPVINALTIGTVNTAADIIPPTISSLNPADNSTDVAIGTNLTVTFSEAIAVGSGDITLKNLTDATQTTIAVTDGSQVSVAGTVLTINPTANLAAGKSYAIWIGPGAIKDLAPIPNFFAGVADDTTWNFSTAAPDTSAPAWIATWPQAGQLSPTSLTVRAQTNETGTAYYIVLPGGATPPSAAQVKALTDSNDAPVSASGSLALTANTEATAPVTGLTAATTYDVYFVAEDAGLNLQASPSMASASTASEPAVITWDTPSAIVDNTDIQSAGLTALAGADFGRTTGTTTVVNNGSVDVEFKSMNSNQNVTLSNGVTVSASGYNFDVACGAPAGVTGNYRTVMTRHMGVAGGAGTITLTGLTIGTAYQIQAYITGSDPNTSTISGSPALVAGGGNNPGNNNGFGEWITGTFTANGNSQPLTHTATSTEPVINALTIGVVSGGGNEFAAWIGGFTGLNGLTGFNDDADGDGLDNGLENFLGTAPNAANAGLTAGALSGNTYTFTHPQNATPASDVSPPVYTWSTDLQTFHASGTSSGGITVTLVAAPNTPGAGTTTVTATATGTTPSKLFLRLGVSQE